jgi:hypothetical protein
MSILEGGESMGQLSTQLALTIFLSSCVSSKDETYIKISDYYRQTPTDLIEKNNILFIKKKKKDNSFFYKKLVDMMKCLRLSYKIRNGGIQPCPIK